MLHCKSSSELTSLYTLPSISANDFLASTFLMPFRAKEILHVMLYIYIHEPAWTGTWNPLICRQMPYLFGHGAFNKNASVKMFLQRALLHYLVLINPWPGYRKIQKNLRSHLESNLDLLVCFRHLKNSIFIAYTLYLQTPFWDLNNP